MSKELGDGYNIGHFGCIATDLKEAGIKKYGDKEYKDCHSSDANAIYEHDTETSVTYSGFCWSCQQGFSPDHIGRTSLGEELGMEATGEVVEGNRKNHVRKEKTPPLTKDEVRDLMRKFPLKGNTKTYRGIRPETAEFFGWLYKKDGMDEIAATYYPETRNGDGWPTGYKIRYHPKAWNKVGATGIKSELAGQTKFNANKNHRDVMIVGGEIDMASAYQMLRDNQIMKKQDEYAAVSVVSPTTGETSAIKQVRAQYDFFDQFENIYIAMDNDDAGNSAQLELAEFLPKEKVRLIYWTPCKMPDGKMTKDPNAMLLHGFQKQFISDFWNAKDYVKDGMKTSIEADGDIEEELLRPKMSLPSFMSGLQKQQAGGIPLGYIVNFIAESGIGKSTLVNEAIRHWVYTSPYKIGILSLELTAPQYMIAMLSREMGYKINLIEDPEEAAAFVKTPEALKARKHLRETVDGESRFTLLDEREGELELVKKQCERMVSRHGCQVIIIDPIQDLFEGVPSEQQNSFLKWMKGMLKKGITFVNVCHVRKGNTSTDKDGKRILRELTEDDVHGISAIVKSAGANIFMSRNKYAESMIEKNTTFITQGKCRWTGITGRISPWYYHLESHTMYDLKTYFKDNPEELPEGYDLEYNPFDKSGKNGTEEKIRKPVMIPDGDMMDDVEI